MSTIPVMGYKNMFHMIGTWTAEQFYFTTEDVADESISAFSVTEQTDLSCEFSTIYDALAVYGISNIVLPREMPAGYVQTEFSVTEAVSGRIRFFELYYRDDSFLALTVTRHADTQSSKYEKTAADVELLTTERGITYYLFSNSSTETAACYIDNLECSVKTNLSREFLKAFIAS